MSGLDALPLIHAASPATRIIILSQSDAPKRYCAGDFFRSLWLPS